MDSLIVLANWLQNVAIYLFAVMVILMPYIFFSVRRRFDPLFRNVSGSKNERFHPLKRAVGYSFCLAAPWWVVRHKYMFKLYKGYDFRADSTKFQITLAWLFFYSGALGSFFQFIVIVIRYCLGLPISGMVDVPVN